MASETAIGRRLYAAVAIVYGVQGLLFSQFVSGLEPVPKALAHVELLIWLNALILIGAGLALLADRTARAGALVLAALLVGSVVVLWGPLAVANLKNAADDLFHTLGVGSAALVLAAGAPPGAEPPQDGWLARAGWLGRMAFGVSLIGFGVMHFVFFQFTADFIPAWIPFHSFWAAFTGVTQIAAGLAVLSGVLGQLAARLSALQYALWAVLVHIPRIAAAPHSHAEWTNIVTISALAVAALIVAGDLGRCRPQP